MFRSILVMLSLLIASPFVAGEAMPIASVSSLEERFDLNPYVEFIADKDRLITYEDLVAGKYEDRWERNTNAALTGQELQVKYWFRFNVKYDKDIAAKRPILSIPNQSSLLYELNLWIPDANGLVREIETGFLRPYTQRDIPNIQYAFHMPETSTEQTISVIGSIDQRNAIVAVLVPLYLVSYDDFQTTTSGTLGALVAFYAIMVALLVYNMCLYIALKEKMYLFYSFFLTVLILDITVLDGTALQYFWPNHSDMNFRLLLVNSILVVAFYDLFVWEALDGIKFSPILRKCFLGLFAFSFISVVYNIFTPHLVSASILAQLVPAATITITFITIFKGWQKKYTAAGYLLTAETLVTLGSVSFMLMLQGKIPINLFSNWGIHWGFFGEALLLSLMLADRTRIAQQASIRNLEKYDTLFEKSNEGLFQLSLTDKTIVVNSSFAKLIGYDNVNSLTEAGLSLDDSPYTELLKLIDKHDGSISGHQYNLRSPKMNESIWVSLSMQTLKDSKGVPTMIDGSMIDITETKLKEQAENEKVIAEARVHAESEFLAAMSHEIRTPMNGVMGMCQILLDLPLEAEVRKYINTIDKSGEALLTIINDILDLKKIEAGKMDLEILDTDLTSLIDDCLAVFPLYLVEKSITLTAEITPDCPRYIKSDPTRIRQILLNFLSNAFKFTDSGNIHIKISSPSPTTDNGEQLLFEVSDTGKGLTEEQQDNLFQSYQQAEASTSRQYGGTGLGLVICKKLAELMNGSIGLTSESQVGSTFWFTIGLEQVNATSEIFTGSEYHRLEDQDESVAIITADQANAKMIQQQLAYLGLNSHLVEYSTTTSSGVLDFDICFCDESVLNSLPKNRSTAGLIKLTPPGRNKRVLQLAEQTKTLSYQELQSPLTFSSINTSIFTALEIEKRQEEFEKDDKPSMSHLNVLIAEDNPTNQLVIKGILKSFDIEPTMVENGIEALGAVKAQQCEFDLILMDCEMPLMDGYEATQKIRLVERLKEKKQFIVALSAHAMSEQKQKAYDSGMDDYIVKPIKVNAVKKILAKISDTSKVSNINRVK